MQKVVIVKLQFTLKQKIFLIVKLQQAYKEGLVQ